MLVTLSAWALLGPERGTEGQGAGHLQPAKEAATKPRTPKLLARGPELCPLLRAGAGHTPSSGQRLNRAPPWASCTVPSSQARGPWRPLSAFQAKANTWLLWTQLVQGTELAHRHRGGRHNFHGFGTDAPSRIHLPLGLLNLSQSESLAWPQTQGHCGEETRHVQSLTAPPRPPHTRRSQNTSDPLRRSPPRWSCR